MPYSDNFIDPDELAAIGRVLEGLNKARGAAGTAVIKVDDAAVYDSDGDCIGKIGYESNSVRSTHVFIPWVEA